MLNIFYTSRSSKIDIQTRKVFFRKKKTTTNVPPPHPHPTAKVRKTELQFLYATCHLVLFYISTKYHQKIPKGIGVTERTQNLFQTKQREITPKVRKPELSFLYMTLSCSTFLPSIIKIFQLQSGQEVLRRC